MLMIIFFLIFFHSVPFYSFHINFSGSINYNAFISQPQLEIIDLRYNQIQSIANLSFHGLVKIREIKLSGNRLMDLNSEVFQDLTTLHKLDLSENFIQKFPVEALGAIPHLKFLNISSNMIQVGLDKKKTVVLFTHQKLTQMRLV